MGITQKELRELLMYDELTGQFHWKKSRRGICAGKTAGTTNADGYRQIRVNGTTYLAHQLAWLYVHGEFAGCDIDHIDRCKQNNAILNLRKDIDRLNAQNVVSAQKNNRSGYRGVIRRKGLWMAQIRHNGEYKYLGYFKTPEEASKRYMEAKRELHQFFPGT